jgi:outer membrane protein assembly factor BamB
VIASASSLPWYISGGIKARANVAVPQRVLPRLEICWNHHVTECSLGWTWWRSDSSWHGSIRFYADRMVPKSRHLLLALGVHLGALLISPAHAADWPQFRYDANRSANSPERLPETLKLNWSRELPSPRPAFPTDHRLRFDASYEPVVMGDTLFVPSMVTDSVTALDTATGNERWHFVADGPVRFAPVAWQDKVFFNSDDGYLYCVKAADGKLLWKFRGLPKDRKDRMIFGNGRLISLFPARGGPVLKSGVIYFSSGIWPGTGVFLHALNAKTGAVIWSNTDSHHLAEANMDHRVKQFAGLTPQGYLALIAGQLVIPCGSQLPGFIDPATGKLHKYSMGWGGREGLPKGSWFVAGAGKFLSHSGDLYDLQERAGGKVNDRMLQAGGWKRIESDPTNHRDLGNFRMPVMGDDTLYYQSGFGNGSRQTDTASIRAYDLAQKPQETAIRKVGTRDTILPVNEFSFPEHWRLPSQLKVHIKAGGRLYAGGKDTVQAIDLPTRDGAPKMSWKATIQGTPHSMLAANGRLFVVTLEGGIHVFGEKVGEEPTRHAMAKTAGQGAADQWAAKADQVLKDTGQREGYALVMGIENSRFVEELVRRSDLYVIAIDTDAQKVADLRRLLRQQGLYGERASAHVANPRSQPLPPYMANLVVLNSKAALGRSANRSELQRFYRYLRPYGGATWSRNESTSQARLEIAKIQEAKLAQAEISRTANRLVIRRVGALPGSSDWSHSGANAANAGASQDLFIKAPLGLLWYDGALRWQRKPGSTVLRVAGGRILVLADDLHALDSYTGRHLWRAPELPAASRATGRADLVAVEDAIYISNGTKCLVLDPATGKRVRELGVPDRLVTSPTAGWSNIRVWNEYLLGTIDRQLVCLNRLNGNFLWNAKLQLTDLSLAVGKGKVFCAELPNKRKPIVTEGKTRTVAYAIATGEVIWETKASSDLRYSEKHDLLLTGVGTFRGANGETVRKGGSVAPIAGDAIVVGDRDSFETFDLLSGEKTSYGLKWNRRGCTDLRAAPNVVTTRFKGNAAYIDMATKKISSLWNIRSGCANNLIPADGILNVPNVTGGCTCNYTPTSMAWAPMAVIENDLK